MQHADHIDPLVVDKIEYEMMPAPHPSQTRKNGRFLRLTQSVDRQTPHGSAYIADIVAGLLDAPLFDGVVGGIVDIGLRRGADGAVGSAWR